MLLTGVGLVMLLSASFLRLLRDGRPEPHVYFIRQGVFAIMGVAAMLFIGKINYQRFRGLAKPLLYLAVILLILVIVPGNPWPLPEQRHPLAGHSRYFAAISALGDCKAGGGDLFCRQHLQERTYADVPLRHRPYAVLLIVLAALVGIEPHLSGAITIMGAGAVMMLVAASTGDGWGWLWVQPDCCCIWCWA